MSSSSRVDRRGFLRNAGRTTLGAAAAGSLGPWASSAMAQEKFPARDINWIIYQAPGGSIDTTARIIQPYLEKNGIKTNLEYVLGAGGRVARSKLFTARPDGYVMMTESAPGGAIDEVIGRAAYKASDFIAIYGWSVVSWQLCVKKDSPIQTFQQFVDECKKRRVVVGTIGRSGSSHIQLAALQKELNLPFGMVHFEGSGKAYPAVLGGHVDAAISGPGSGSRMRDSLHFLAVTGEEREKALPDVPTLTELGFRVTPIDQILVRHGHAKGAGRSHRDAVERIRQSVRRQDAVGADAEGRRISQAADASAGRGHGAETGRGDRALQGPAGLSAIIMLAMTNAGQVTIDAFLCRRCDSRADLARLGLRRPARQVSNHKRRQCP